MSAGVAQVTTGVALAMVNICGTSGAALYWLFPDWWAVTSQLPAPEMWTVAPVTAHCPEAVNVTGSAELAVAVTPKSASP